jgi:hypothetical protein
LLAEKQPLRLALALTSFCFGRLCKVLVELRSPSVLCATPQGLGAAGVSVEAVRALLPIFAFYGQIIASVPPFPAAPSHEPLPAAPLETCSIQ